MIWWQLIIFNNKIIILKWSILNLKWVMVTKKFNDLVCPACGASFKVSSFNNSNKIKCPNCGHEFETAKLFPNIDKNFKKRIL